MSAARNRLLAGAALAVALAFAGATPALAQAAPQSYTSYTRYDALGRVTGTIAPDPDGAAPYTFIAVRNTYDTAGNLWKVEKGVLNAWQAETVAPANWGAAFTVDTTMEATFDAMGHKLTERVKDSALVTVSLTQMSYTPAGSLECTAVRMNPAQFATPPVSACDLGAPDTSSGVPVNDRITKNVYVLGDPTRIEKIQQGVGLPSQRDYVSYTYTANGKQASVTDARGLKASYTYDGFDQLKVWAMPNPSFAGVSSTTDKEEYRYDANGNMTERWLRDHSATNTSQIIYTYDALNRQITRTPTGETTLWSAYDLRGLKTGDWTGDGKVVSYGYDGFSRLTSENTLPTGVMIYAYDANGNRTRMTWAMEGFYVDYDYDQLNRMTKIREAGATSGIGVLASYAYNADGSRSTVSYGNGTQRLYKYDSAGRVRGVKLDLAGTASDLTIGQVAGAGTPIGYNPAGQITLLTRTNPTDAYAWTAHSTIQRDYAVNGLNQYTNTGGVTFAYDGRGNLTNSGASTYTYNRLNQLTSGPNGNGGTVQLGYDPVGRLGEVTAGGATTRLLYAGANLVGEVGVSGTILRRYVHGPGTDEPVVWYEGSGTTNRRWLQSDQLGSVVAVSDGAGAMLGINRYDEYGIPQAGNVGRFQYTGQTWWGELGMYNYKARWYSASLGRFMQVDPIGYKDNLNLYAYVGNDPANGRDPTGLARVCESSQGGVPRCVYVDGNGDGNARDNDLSRRQVNQLSRHFSNFIASHSGMNLTNYGKNVVGNASNDDKNMTRAVSQFVGASVTGSAATQWSNVMYIRAESRHYFGVSAYYEPLVGSRGEDLGRGRVTVGGRIGWFGGGYLYDSPSNMARALLHEMGHTPVGRETDVVSHGRVDAQARHLLKAYGLDGGGCWSVGVLGGFPGC